MEKGVTMDCACNIEVEVDDYEEEPDVFEQKIVKAKTVHWCYECRDVIEKGTEYEYVKGLWEGTFSVYKTCLDCVSLRAEFFTGYVFTQLWCDFSVYLESCYGEIPEKCISKLLPGARGRVCEKIEDYWEHLEESGY